MRDISVTDELDYMPELPKHKSFGIGCVGSGFIMADCHLVAYKQAGLDPVAIMSADRQQGQDVAARHGIADFYDDLEGMLSNPNVEIVDIAVPPDIQIDIIREVVKYKGKIKGILAQKPIGCNYSQAKEIVGLCSEADIVLGVNQNMRYDQSIRACKSVLERGYLGEPVLATIDMRAIPHWMEWQERLGFVTLRMMSIHHLDTFRFLFGDPVRVFASVGKDPRTAEKFDHFDGICLYILEYENGFRAAAWDDVWAGPAREGAESDIYIKWRVEGTGGMARGTIGWPEYPERRPSTIDFTTKYAPGQWFKPRWDEVWFPDAFVGPMAQLLCAVESGDLPEIGGEDNLNTMALVDACYKSAKLHRAVEISEIMEQPEKSTSV